MVKVLICEDQTLVRQGLVALLESEPGITIVGEAVNGREAVEQTGALRPDAAGGWGEPHRLPAPPAWPPARGPGGTERGYRPRLRPARRGGP